MFEMIAFDADDTLWQNETLFTATQAKYAALLARYTDQPWTGDELYAAEMRNLDVFGYGIKGFTLSMIETAIEISAGQISASDIHQIIGFAREMRQAPVQLLPHVADVIPRLAAERPLMLITKGDLLDQESKIARSGIADYFQQIEIVSDKTSDNYRRLLARHALNPYAFLMVGNSLRSDILPVVELGAQAVYIPYHRTWRHEHAEPSEHHRYFEIEHIGLLPELLTKHEL